MSIYTNFKCCIFVKINSLALRELITKYKPVIKFIVLFLGAYLLLSVAYGGYLKVSSHYGYTPDFITDLVANQSSWLINAAGYKAQVIPHDAKPQMKLIVDGNYLANIIEGCNAMSIIVLFIAFVIAFAQKLKKTVLFILGGSLLIYIVNIVRIAILAIALYKYPEHQSILHSVVFPGIIYGMVFLLWMLWIKMIKKSAT